MLCMDPEQEGRVYFEEGGLRRLGEGVRGGGGGENSCDICGMDQTLYPITNKEFLQLSQRCSPETSIFSNDIAWIQAFSQKQN